MPPLPRPQGSAAADPGAARSRARRQGPSSPGSDARGRPVTSGATRGRQTNLDALRIKVERMYMVMGTMLSPFGRFIPVLEPVGKNLRVFSEEASVAWIELAQEDQKVRQALEAMTSASAWGSVIGIHIAIFASAIPGGDLLHMVPEPQMPNPDGLDQFRAMGATEEELETAKQMAAQMQGAGNMPARDRSAGGPGDSLGTPPAPEFDPRAKTASTAAQAGIPTPEELGARNGGGGGPFPADSGPIRGA